MTTPQAILRNYHLATTMAKSNSVRPKPLSPKAGAKLRVGKKKTRYDKGGSIKKK